MEDKKRVGLIVTIVTVLLCGCPGLCAIAFGAMVSTMGYDLENWGWDVSGNPQAVAIPAICIGALMVLIPVAAGVYTLVQSRKEKQIEDVEVPPAI
ncbi:MAG: hypothetical protein PVI99_01075 [Anaerolineales bacterium]|jgi:hypothetical protein